MKPLLALSLLGFLVSSQAQAQMPRCEGTDRAQLRSCYQQNLKEARKMLDRAITDSCRKQGVKGPDLLACRTEMMSKTAASIQQR